MSLALNAFGEVPDWLANFDVSQKYPPKLYLAAIGVASGSDAEAVETAQSRARAEVSSIIMVNIKGLLSSVSEEVNNEYHQYLSSVSQSSTSIQLMSLQVDTYPDRDKKDPKIYAVAYANRVELRRIYSKKKDDLLAQIEKIVAEAQADEANSKTLDAVKKYLSAYSLYEELKEAETILLVVNESKSIESAFVELDKETVEQDKAIMSQAEISNKIDQLLSQSTGSIGEVARAIVLRLSQQASFGKQVWVNPFTYEDTGMSGTFARYFQSELESSMAQMADWKIPSQARAISGKSPSFQNMRDMAREAGAQHYIYGTYWEQGGMIKLVTTMRDVNTNEVLAAADISFSPDILGNDISLKPANYESALIAQQAFDEGQIVSGQLQVDIWTNKGNENVAYISGETMKAYIRVNRESYIRLLYILADGRWTLLYDNYYVDRSKANQIVEIPMEFECSPPFGGEMLVAIARTERFSSLDTITEDGYEFLDKDPELPPQASARSLASDIRGGKGFKPKKEEAVSIPDFSDDLNSNRITDALLKEFENNSMSLSLNATVSTLVPDKEWIITDLSCMQTYLVVKDDKISIYKIQQAEAKLMITTMEE